MNNHIKNTRKTYDRFLAKVITEVLVQFKDENPPDNAPNVYKKNDKLVMNTIIVTPRLLLRPILELLSDGEYHTKAQADEVIADKLFSSTKEEYSKIKNHVHFCLKPNLAKLAHLSIFY